MGSLNYAFQFVKDVHITIGNLSGGMAKFSQDYYKKKKNAHSKYLVSRSKNYKI